MTLAVGMLDTPVQCAVLAVRPLAGGTGGRPIPSLFLGLGPGPSWARPGLGLGLAWAQAWPEPGLGPRPGPGPSLPGVLSPAGLRRNHRACSLGLAVQRSAAGRSESTKRKHSKDACIMPCVWESLSGLRLFVWILDVFFTLV